MAMVEFSDVTNGVRMNIGTQCIGEIWEDTKGIHVFIEAHLFEDDIELILQKIKELKK